MYEDINRLCSADEFDTVTQIVKLLDERQPKSVWEIGSGPPTAAISFWKPERFISYSITEDQHSKTTTLLNAVGLPPVCQLISPQRSSVSCCSKTYTIGEPGEQFDLVLIHQFNSILGFLDRGWLNLTESGVIAADCWQNIALRKEVSIWQKRMTKHSVRKSIPPLPRITQYSSKIVLISR
jgi:hypothetical protein